MLSRELPRVHREAATQMGRLHNCGVIRRATACDSPVAWTAVSAIPPGGAGRLARLGLVLLAVLQPAGLATILIYVLFSLCVPYEPEEK